MIDKAEDANSPLILKDEEINANTEDLASIDDGHSECTTALRYVFTSAFVLAVIYVFVELFR